VRKSIILEKRGVQDAVLSLKTFRRACPPCSARVPPHDPLASCQWWPSIPAQSFPWEGTWAAVPEKAQGYGGVHMPAVYPLI
jgi:hypothetical protein